MLRIVITKDGRQFKSYTDLHCEIVRTNKIDYHNVAQELVIDRGITYNVRRALPDKLQTARDVDALYAYGYYRDNQGLRIGD